MSSRVGEFDGVIQEFIKVRNELPAACVGILNAEYTKWAQGMVANTFDLILPWLDEATKLTKRTCSSEEGD